MTTAPRGSLAPQRGEGLRVRGETAKIIENQYLRFNIYGEWARRTFLAIHACQSSRAFYRFGMESYELLREVFEKATPKQVAAELGLSLSMIYKWAEPPDHASGSGTGNPLDRIESLLASTGDQRLVQWICQRAGGFFILNPKNAQHPGFLIPATNQIVQEFADLLAVVATAAADNQITSDEAKQIRARWEELKTVTEGFVTCCEEGNFRPLRTPPKTP